MPSRRSITSFHRADDMLRLLRQRRLDNSREALLVEQSTVDLLIVDDFALEPMTRYRPATKLVMSTSYSWNVQAGSDDHH
jgi:DNA replication protein DnaC